MTAIRIQSIVVVRNESDLHVSDGVILTQGQKPASEAQLSSRQARARYPDVDAPGSRGACFSQAEHRLFTLSFCTVETGQRDRSRNWEGTNKALHSSGVQDRRKNAATGCSHHLPY